MDQAEGDDEFDDREEPLGDSTGGVIPYKNEPALIAYYVGLFSILPIIGLPMGVTAVFLGIKGLRKRRAQPEVKGSAHAWVGIGCGGLCALVWLSAVLLFLFAYLAKDA